MSQVCIIDTGIANVASVKAAFARLGWSSETSRDAQRVRESPFVVLPGVGSFGAGMRALRKFALDGAIIERTQQDRPLLCICLGLQLLCTSSEESPGIEGLGVIDTHVTRFDSGVRTPQHGWNRVGDAYAYFSNSYRLEAIPAGWSGQLSDHGGDFVASIARGSAIACQFHPELSGAFGTRLIRSWLETNQEVSRC